MEKYKNRIENYLSFIAEYGIYLYMFFLLFDKGEGLRNVGLYSALTAWLILIFVTKKIKLSADIITCGFLAFLFSIVLSSFFSLEPIYSFSYLKKDVLKAVITFFIISSYFDTKMLLRLSKVICSSGLIILIFGLHGFLTSEENLYTSTNIFLSVDKNEYGFFIGLFFPFFLMFFIKNNTMWGKSLWGLSLVWGVLGTIFSASRGAMGNIFAAMGVWAAFLLKRKHLIKVLMVTFIFFVLSIISFNFWPEPLKRQFLTIQEELWTVHDRTFLFWEPALEAVKKKPILGWGYGKRIIGDPRPFENGKMPSSEHKGGLHSTFISVLFQQGVVGILSYLLLLFSTSFMLLKIIRSETDERKLLAIALLSITVGSFFVNSFLLSVPLRRIAPFLGMSSALLKHRTKYLND
ncbi:MAG: O-antigen ligase family protein [Nitrospirota bacterium]